MARPTSRPGRTLLIFFVAMVALGGLAAIGGTFKPRLGLDLEGGTRITLTATGQGINQQNMQQARDIINARVNGNGVTESAVNIQGSKNIVIEIPGKQRQDLVDSVSRTAQLRFRIVAKAIGPASKTPSKSPSASPSKSPSPSPKSSPSSTASPAPSKGSNRPAPAFDASTAKSPSPSPKPTASATPQVTDTAGPSDPIKWAANPPTAWLVKLATFQCPGKGKAALVNDDPGQPLVTCDSAGNRYLLSKAVIEGTSLKSASYGTPPQGVGWVVLLSLKGQAVKTFADISRSLNASGGQFAMVLDGQVIEAAGFDEPILDGSAQIHGNFTETSAKSLANSLKYGALPIRFAAPSAETIGPSLAGSQLSAGLVAGAIGLAIVMIYCLLYYRGLGLVVVASLIIAGLVTYATVLVLAQAAGFALTLPGIAGLIVAVGITADSFIVYFERIRDEMRDGRSMRVAVEAGWKRARNTCLAADAVSFLAAVVLYIFAIGVVRGFAFALGISTIIDVVVFFWFTKPMMSLLARRRFFNSGSKLSGLSAETLGVDQIAPDRGARTLAGGRA